MNDYDEAKDYVDRQLPQWKPKEVRHKCMYPPGRLRIVFSWRWPFVHIWRSKGTCLCEIIEILDEIKR